MRIFLFIVLGVKHPPLITPHDLSHDHSPIRFVEKSLLSFLHSLKDKVKINMTMIFSIIIVVMEYNSNSRLQKLFQKGTFNVSQKTTKDFFP